MPSAARHVEFIAQEGRGAALAAVLLEVAESLRGTAGCDSWVVSRVPGEPERLVVDERWRDEETMAGAAAAAHDDPLLGRAMALLHPERRPEVTELRPAGGPGLLPTPRPGVQHRALLDVEDQAAAFGFASQGESRFAGKALGLERSGIALHRMPAGAVSAFGHRHANAEETYVVLSGGGRIRVGDEILDLAPRDAVRVAPELTRGLAAGPDGLEVLVVGPRCAGDGELLHDWSMD